MKKLKAEWQEQEALLVTWPHYFSDWANYIDEIEAFYIEFIDIVTKYQRCLILCNDIKRTKNLVRMNKNVELIKIPTNDTWVRDYGPISEYLFGFNGWGLKFASNFDNKSCKKLFPNLQVKNMILEGGSIDYNGNGVLLTTSECLLEANRNPAWSQNKIEKKLKKYLGIKKVLWLEHGYLAGDDTDSHIDTLARFLDEKTIAYVKCDDIKDEHFYALYAMEKELENRGFDLVPLPLPLPNYFGGERLPATYCNFVFINGAVIVPTYNEPNDEKVLQIFRDFFPDRDIIGLDSNVLIRQHGSIHCASCNIFKGQM